MGFGEWWRVRKRNAGAAVEFQDDARAIARLAPEVSAMSFADGVAYVLHAMTVFEESCTPAQAAILALRIAHCQRLWKAQELTMPYWGNLTVLRNLQADIAAQTIRQYSPTMAWG